MKTIMLILVVLICVPMWAQITSPQHQKEEEHAFPAEDRIQLVLTQSERAFDVYDQAIEQENLAGGKIATAVARDREVLKAARDLLSRLKKSPEGFNGPAGFLLVGDLDDASRNMAVCMGQAGWSPVSSNVGEHLRRPETPALRQTCLDASTLLYTVSEQHSTCTANSF